MFEATSELGAGQVSIRGAPNPSCFEATPVDVCLADKNALCREKVLVFARTSELCIWGLLLHICRIECIGWRHSETCHIPGEYEKQRNRRDLR